MMNNSNMNDNSNAFSKLFSSANNNENGLMGSTIPGLSNHGNSSITLSNSTGNGNNNNNGGNNFFGLSGLQQVQVLGGNGNIVGGVGGVGAPLSGGGGGVGGGASVSSGVSVTSSMATGGGNGGSEELLPLVMHLTNPEQVRCDF